MEITFTLNGDKTTVTAAPGQRLIDLLRDVFGLCGTKESCGQGECGVCTVLLDNRAVHSCLLLAAEADGHAVTTIEGLFVGQQLDPVQQAFIDCGAIQCGYCTPGMVLSAKGLLLQNPNPDDEAIKEALAGNLCRCTGYVKILEAVKLAAERMRNHAGH